MQPIGAYETKAPYNYRVDWHQKPGFWDPYTVTQLCVSNILKDVYVKRLSTRLYFGQERGELFDPVPSPGLMIYSKPIEISQEVMEGVEKYIKFPCKQSLTRLVHEKPVQALQFLLCYLRLRGPFMAWDSRDADCRSLPILCETYLHRMPELDFLACIMIGRYLNFLLHVAAAHRWFWLIEPMSQIWGPLILRLNITDDQMHLPINKEDMINFPIQTLKKIMKINPWGRFQPFENVGRTIYNSNKRDLYHKYIELEDECKRLNHPPAEFANHAGKHYFTELQARGPYVDELKHIHPVEKLAMQKNYYRTDKPIAPDACDGAINYGGPRNQENFF